MRVDGRSVAIPGSLAVVAGVLAAYRLQPPHSLLLVSLLGLGLAWRRPVGYWLALTALGWLTGAGSRPVDLQLDLGRPVTAHVRITRAWRPSDYGLQTWAKAVWLRQGRHTVLWRQKLKIFLAPSVSAPESGSLRLTGYLKRASAVRNGVDSRAPPWQLRVKAEPFVKAAARRLRSQPRLPPAIANGLRRRLVSRLEIDAERWPWRNRLVEALVLGRADVLPDRVQRSIRAAGQAHLFALSGLHLSLVAAFVWQLTIGSSGRWRSLAVISLVVVYGLLTGGDRPSLQRSALMLFAVLGAHALRRPAYALNTLAWVAAAMLLVEPDLVEDLGFQLSFAATAGIVSLVPVLDRRWSWLPSWIRLPLSAGFGAHLATLPWALSVFHLENPWAPWIFLGALPWAVGALSICLTWTICALVFAPLTRLVDAPIEALGRILEGLSSLQRPDLMVIPTALGWWPAVAIAVGAVLWVRSRLPVSLLVLLTGSLLVFDTGGSTRSRPQLALLDVGQGDAVLLRDGDDSLLVDGGGWRSGDIAQTVLVPTLVRLGVRRLSSVLLTHPDVDHCAGLEGLTSYLDVGSLWVGPGWSSSRCVDRLLTTPGLRIRPLWRGERLEVGRWKLEVLHPAAGSREGRNERSLVVLARLGEHRVVLAGDLEKGGERDILGSVAAESWSAVDILKVGHHGSNTSTSRAWLVALEPRLALISCGSGNRYGHPAPEVLARLRRQGARVLRSDRDGGIRIVFSADRTWHLEYLSRP